MNSKRKTSEEKDLSHFPRICSWEPKLFLPSRHMIFFEWQGPIHFAYSVKVVPKRAGKRGQCPMSGSESRLRGQLFKEVTESVSCQFQDLHTDFLHCLPEKGSFLWLKSMAQRSDLPRWAGLAFSRGVQVCANMDISSQAGLEVVR